MPLAAAPRPAKAAQAQGWTLPESQPVDSQPPVALSATWSEPVWMRVLAQVQMLSVQVQPASLLTACASAVVRPPAAALWPEAAARPEPAYQVPEPRRVRPPSGRARDPLSPEA